MSRWLVGAVRGGRGGFTRVLRHLISPLARSLVYSLSPSTASCFARITVVSVVGQHPTSPPLPPLGNSGGLLKTPLAHLIIYFWLLVMPAVD